MHASAAAHSPSILRVFSVLLLATHTLFLWMFFSADSVAQLLVPGRPDLDMIAAARFAAQWKHGMAGNSPLYMPGFFAVGLVTWLWSIGRPLRGLVAEWLAILAIAFSLAAILAPLGAVHAIEAFERSFGLPDVAATARPSLGSMVLSTLTLFSWTAAIVCTQLSIRQRSVKPMALPVFLHYVLLVIRPWAINDFTTQWFGDTARGRPVAVLSLVAVPVLVGGLILYQLRREHLRPSEAGPSQESATCAPSRTR